MRGEAMDDPVVQLTHEQRLAKMRTLRFGDLVRNGWAGERNPHRDGYFVMAKHHRRKLNGGWLLTFTDGKGATWELFLDAVDRMEVLKPSPFAVESCQGSSR